MIRILHLSDFHLNEQNLRDWKNYVKDALHGKLNELNNERKINLILSTGDHIDKGGTEFKGASNAFKIFKNEVIEPIINELKIDSKHFLITPGNHDIERDKDREITEKGLFEHLNNHNNISNFILNAQGKKDFYGIERIRAFKEFEKKMYFDSDTNQMLTPFGSSFKTFIGDISVGVCCLNSSWRAYTKNDINRLIVGEDQLIENTKFISDCQVKIALIHHPLDWLINIERGIITKHISKDFNMLLVGHTHQSLTTMSIGFQRSLFINISPSGLNDIRSDSRSYANGFTVIDYDIENSNISCEYLRYNHSSKSFVLNTDIEDNGKFTQTIPPKSIAKNENVILKCISTIREDHYPEMDNHLIMHKVDKLKTINLKDAFILPPIVLANTQNDEEQILSLSDITKDKSSHIYFGNQESGKTTLLYRIIREYADEFDLIGKVPAYFDFENQGNKEIETLIKEYLKCSSKEVEYLIKESLLVLIIDNLNYKGTKIEKIKKLHKFINKQENKDIRIIATAENEVTGVIPTEYFSLSIIPFKNYLINGLKTKEIKSLMKFWLPEDNEIEYESKLDKMVANFCSYSLPSTAMSVSLYLWSLENPDKPPINHAVLMEIYIELLLQKLSKENIYRDKFDFTNKVQLLARIAEIMDGSEEENCCIPMSKYLGTIEEYFNELVGFDFIEPTKIADYFLERKIFIKKQGDRIKFTYSCYYHFFLAKRMEYNPAYRKFILDEERYHKYFREIDYYTALVRSDLETFNTISKRFIDKFKPTEFILEKLDVDKYFTPIAANKDYKPATSEIDISKVKENRPTNQMIEKYYDKRLKSINDPGKIIKVEGKISLDLLMVMMANVLRNSEGIENRKLKSQIYNELIKYNIVYMILYKEWIIRYVKDYDKLPPSIPSEIRLDYLLKNIPLFVQQALNRHVGTPKLSAIILDKINLDKNNKSFTKSDIEAFLSVTLFSDIQGNGFDKQLKYLVKRLKNNPTQDYLYMKVLDYYYRRTRSGSPNEEMYLNILADLKMKTQKLPRRIKEKVIKFLEEGKKIFIESSEKYEK
jgi:DNA repair exonuclease SbcCD nuclease subunit